MNGLCLITLVGALSLVLKYVPSVRLWTVVFYGAQTLYPAADV